MVFSRAAPSVVLVRGTGDSGEVQGSGVIVARDRVVTNLHVVARARALTVKLLGQELPAKVLAQTSAKLDLALLEVTLPQGSRVASLRNVKDVAVGERVFAIGNPRGLEQTLSEGLVSALRPEGKSQVLQTSAAISPGSSGGGLFDARGKLIGITTSTARDSQSLNFAHPSDWVQELLSGKSEVAPARAPSEWTVSHRPQHVLCRLKDRSTWGLFSEGLELLQTSALDDLVWVADLEKSAVRVRTKRSADRTELVLLDLSRQNQVALFAGTPESLARISRWFDLGSRTSRGGPHEQARDVAGRHRPAGGVQFRVGHGAEDRPGQ